MEILPPFFKKLPFPWKDGLALLMDLYLQGAQKLDPVGPGVPRICWPQVASSQASFCRGPRFQCSIVRYTLVVLRALVLKCWIRHTRSIMEYPFQRIWMSKEDMDERIRGGGWTLMVAKAESCCHGSPAKKGCQPMVSTRSWRVSRRSEVVSGVPGTFLAFSFSDNILPLNRSRRKVFEVFQSVNVMHTPSCSN